MSPRPKWSARGCVLRSCAFVSGARLLQQCSNLTLRLKYLTPVKAWLPSMARLSHYSHEDADEAVRR
jgi:hypothetical protein